MIIWIWIDTLCSTRYWNIKNKNIEELDLLYIVIFIVVDCIYTHLILLLPNNTMSMGCTNILKMPLGMYHVI